MTMQEKKQKYREELAESFINILEEKGLEWKKEWNGVSSAPRNGITGAHYRGTNAFYLSLLAMANGYTDPRWVTFVQIADKNNRYHPNEKWRLQKGSKGAWVEYWYQYDLTNKKAITWSEYRDARGNGRAADEFRLSAKYTLVFNAENVEGMPELKMPEPNEITPDELIGTLSENMGVEILNDGGNRAYYSPMEDKIHLPEPGAFTSDYAYNATALHELAHSTGHPARLNREQGGFFGSQEYAYEELVAEISSCFMGASLASAATEEHINNHKAYVSAWVQEIREKPDVLIHAVKDSEAAADYMELKAGLLNEQDYNKSAEAVQEVEVPVAAPVAAAIEAPAEMAVPAHKPTVVVNLFGGPGAGKTTAARQIKNELEKRYDDISVAVVGEYATELIKDGKADMLNGTLENQIIIYNEQHKRVQDLIGKADIIITDSPDILSAVYVQDKSEDAEIWKQKIISDFKQNQNFNIMIKRGHSKFEQSGRIHDEAQSKVLDRKIGTLLEGNNIFYCGWRRNSEKALSQNIYNNYIRQQVKRLERKEKMPSKLDLAKNFPIRDAAALAGLTVTGHGNVLSTKEHDSLKLYVNSNSYYRFSTRQGGTAIDLLVKERGMSISEAIDALARLAGYEEPVKTTAKTRAEKPAPAVMPKPQPAHTPIEIPVQQKPQTIGIPMPEKAENNKRVFGYLAGRGISGSLIYEYLGRGLLYEDASKHNCVFVGQDREGTAQAGYMRGTLTYGEPFKGCVAGSNKEYGVFFEGGEKKQTLVCFEAPIDMMSFQELFGKDYSCVALGGVNGIGIEKVLENHPEIKNIAFAFDNDAPGQKAAKELSAEYKRKGYGVKSIVPKDGKDWNDWLQMKQAEAKVKKNTERKAKTR